MKQLLFSIFSLVIMLQVSAQEDNLQIPPKAWNDTVKVSLLFNQTAFNAEWTGGGTSSIAGDINFVYTLNFQRGSWTWDNRLVVNYGLARTEDSEFTKKTNDRLEFHSTIARQLSDSNFHFSFFTNLRTQFAKGYEFHEDSETGEEYREEISGFFSPAYLQAGPGLLWKKNDNLKVNLAPSTARIIFVDPKFTSYSGYENRSYFGVSQGKSARYEFGAALSGYAKFDIVENVNLEHILNIYSNYLDVPGNIDIDYTLNMVMKINEFLSTNLVFQAIYDDNAIGAFQVREVFGIGITYIN